MNTVQRMGFVAATILAATLTVAAQAFGPETLLYDFQKNQGGYYPSGALLQDQVGNLYGATAQGGTSGSCGLYGCGVVFELSPGSNGWTYSVLYDFNNYKHNSIPLGSLVMDAAGNLYGATVAFSSGEIFELSRNGSGGWTETVLYVFGHAYGIGSGPVALDTEGNLFGVSQYGGAYNLGFVFKLSKASGLWALDDLHDFSGSDGSFPAGSVVFDRAGNIYGVASQGGTGTGCPLTQGCGVVFELEKAAGWSYKILWQLDGANGSDPQNSLMMASKGNLYGTAATGGANGFGTVFELTPAGGIWQSTTLHTFTDANGDGAAPNTALVMDSAGNLYGTTIAGGGGLGECVADGFHGCGEAFELSPTKTGWKSTSLRAFTGRTDGAFPGGVIVDLSGNVFGTTEVGGTEAAGLVFEFSRK